MDNALTDKEKWEAIWADVKLPKVVRPTHDIQTQFARYLPKDGGTSFLEIGCAPGGWMAYFAQRFGYRVAGLEYAAAAAVTTEKNMAMLGIDAAVYQEDFFAFDCGDNPYDIVFSKGFVEHFVDLAPVFERLCGMSRDYVVTMVPNLYGVNGWISKTIRPAVFAEHTPIDLDTLRTVHEQCGMETLFCDFIGGVRLVMPGAHAPFFKRHKTCARAVNFPVRVFNRISIELGRVTGITPRSRALSEGLLYIGRKGGGNGV